MNAQSLISHRMFVAALSHAENGAAHSQPDHASDNGGKNRARRAQHDEQSSSTVGAQQLLFAVVTDGLQSARI